MPVLRREEGENAGAEPSEGPREAAIAEPDYAVRTGPEARHRALIYSATVPPFHHNSHKIS